MSPHKGANPNLRNDKGSTALHWSVRYNRTKIVKILLQDAKKINPKYAVDIHQKRYNVSVLLHVYKLCADKL